MELSKSCRRSNPLIMRQKQPWKSSVSILLRALNAYKRTLSIFL
jgi:hypothetical protein